MTYAKSETGSEDISLYGSDYDSEMEGSNICVRIDNDSDLNLAELYHPVLNLIRADLNLLKIQNVSNSNSQNGGENTSYCQSRDFISVAFVIFLHEEGMLECERIQNARRHFENPAWEFHHSEDMKRKMIHPYPYNSQEFYCTSSDLPLWAVRQVHYGLEHFRLMLFVSDNTWYDMLGLYKVILGKEPDLQRQDFCLYTISKHRHYDVQFAMKRLESTIRPTPLGKVRIVFSVSEIGQIVPLCPNSCQAVSDTEWSTTDHDGNVIILNVVQKTNLTYSPFIRNGPTTKSLNGFYV